MSSLFAAATLLIGIRYGHRSDESLRVVLLWAAQNLLARPNLDQFAVLHHCDAIGERVHDGEVVTDEQARELQSMR